MTSHYSCVSISYSAQANLHLPAVAGVVVTGKNVLYKRRSGSTTHYRNTIQSVKYLSNRLVNKSVRYYWLVADYRSMSASLVYNLLIWASNISLLIKGAAQNTGPQYVRLIVNVGGGARLMRWSDQVTTGHTKCWAGLIFGVACADPGLGSAATTHSAVCIPVQYQLEKHGALWCFNVNYYICLFSRLIWWHAQQQRSLEPNP